MSEKKIRAEGFTCKKKFLHKQGAKKKFVQPQKFPTPPITFLMVRPLNNAMAKEISKEIDEFYGKLEMKYYSGIQREDVPQKLAVQDLFKNNVPVFQ